MIVVTTPFLAGHRVRESKGMVFGLVVRSRGLGGNIMAALRSLPGGEIHASRGNRPIVHPSVLFSAARSLHRDCRFQEPDLRRWPPSNPALPRDPTRSLHVHVGRPVQRRRSRT